MKCMERVYSAFFFFFLRKHQTFQNDYTTLHSYQLSHTLQAGLICLFFFFLALCFIAGWQHLCGLIQVLLTGQGEDAEAPILSSSVSEPRAQEQLSSCLLAINEMDPELHLASCICLLFSLVKNKLMIFWVSWAPKT